MFRSCQHLCSVISAAAGDALNDVTAGADREFILLTARHALGNVALGVDKSNVSAAHGVIAHFALQNSANLACFA